MFSAAVVEFLFTLALTTLVLRSYIRYVRQPRASQALSSSLSRPVVLVVGAAVCFAFIVACVRRILALLG